MLFFWNTRLCMNILCVFALKVLHSVAYQMSNCILRCPPFMEIPKFQWFTSGIHLTDKII